MKKLLIVLMVVAMASFLFVGCMPSVTPPVVEEEEEEEEEVVVPATQVPIINTVTGIDITSSATQYLNKKEAADGITVTGNASTFAEVKVYIDGVPVAASADVTVTGTWALSVTKAELGTDGAKTLKAVATETGLADATSTEYAFTLDTDLPGIDSVAATADAPLGATTTGGTAVATTTSAGTAILYTNASDFLVAAAGDVEDGVWLLDMLAAASLQITDPNSNQAVIAVAAGDTFLADCPIPGVSFTLKLTSSTGAIATISFNDNAPLADTIVDTASFVAAAFLPGDFITVVTASGVNDATYTIATIVGTTITLVLTDSLTTEAAAAGTTITSDVLAAGQHSKITCTARTQSAAIVDRATLKFDEDVTITVAAAGTYVFNNMTTGLAVLPAGALYKENTCYWNNFAAPLAQYDFIEFVVTGVKDLAGNTITAASTATCYVGAASTALKP